MTGNCGVLENIPSLQGVSVGKVEIVPVALPALKENEIRVQTAFSMISPGTELHFILDNHTKKAVYPVRIGYQSTGEVVGVGSEVKSVKTGDRVYAQSFHAAFNNTVEKYVHKLPTELNLQHACPTSLLCVSLRSIRATQVRFGDSVAVFGLGLVGLYALHLAKLSGAYPVIGFDPVAKRRDIARTLGADFVFDPKQLDARQAVHDCTRNEGAAAAIDATGSPSVIASLPSLTAPFGKIAVLGGIHAPVPMDLYTHIQKSNQTLVGCGTASPRDYPHDEFRNAETIIAMIRAGIVRPQPTITHTADWSRGPEMYQTIIKDKEAALGVVFDWRTFKAN